MFFACFWNDCKMSVTAIKSQESSASMQSLKEIPMVLTMSIILKCYVTQILHTRSLIRETGKKNWKLVALENSEYLRLMSMPKPTLIY